MRILKKEAETLFAKMGLTMSAATNVFYRQAVRTQGIPFPLTVAEGSAQKQSATNLTELVSTKSAVFSADYSTADITSAFIAAVQNEIAEKRRKGFPVARYDMHNNRAYLEFPDGTREYVNGQN